MPASARSNASLYFGDIHNHNALGYGLGSLERSIDIARSHLDFFAFTGHSSWHDMPTMEGHREKIWSDGFEKLRNAWPKVQQLTADANKDGSFTAFLGFEWHSSRFGDQCVILGGDRHPLIAPDNVGALRSYCLEHGGLMIPHHLAYATGHRGVNWDVFTEECTPLVEIYSEHGNSEFDRGGFPYFSHSMGGRVTANTARHALDRGLRFGFAASTDNHRGFPGAYGEGILGVWSEALTRDAILKAIRQRRTVAYTGDRIGLWYEVDGQPLGSIISAGRDVEVSWEVEGRDALDVVEVIVNGEIADRFFPTADAPAPDEPCQVRLEWGWGPWADIDLARVCDWAFEIRADGMRIDSLYPCLQSGPFDEDRRHRIRQTSDQTVAVTSYTGRQGAYRQNPNQSVILSLQPDDGVGGAGLDNASLDLTLKQPASQTHRVTMRELADSSVAIFTGPFPAECLLWHRPVSRTSSSHSGRTTIRLPKKDNYVYLRVREHNGHIAWGSPVFVSRAHL